VDVRFDENGLDGDRLEMVDIELSRFFNIDHSSRLIISTLLVQIMSLEILRSLLSNLYQTTL